LRGARARREGGEGNSPSAAGSQLPSTGGAGGGSMTSPPNNGSTESRANHELVPAIGDEASIVWAMGKKVGDTLDYTDERGRRFKIRLVGAVANSILQGNLIIAEDELVARFPTESGYRMFLIDAPANDVNEIT